MSIKDVIKGSVYEKLGGGTGLSVSGIAIIFIMACLVGVYMYVLYKNTSKNAFYSKDLAITLAGMPVIIAAIMIAMQSNLLVSLGMVGALSIVRFRTAIKNPMDLLYLFWSISAGIICGVGLYVLAIALTVFMTILVMGLSLIPSTKASCVLVLRTSGKYDADAVKKVLKENAKYSRERSKSIKNGTTEVIFEVRATDDDKLIDAINAMDKFDAISFLTHDGELRA